MMPNRNRSKRPLQRLISHNSEGLTETEHVSSTDRPRPSSSSNSSGHESIPSKSVSRHSLSRSSRGSRTRSLPPRNSRRTSVSSVVVQPNDQRQADEDVAPAWAKKMLEAQEQSQARLFKLEAELRKSDICREMEGTVKQKHKFNKAIYEEQYSLNSEIYKN